MMKSTLQHWHHPKILFLSKKIAQRTVNHLLHHDSHRSRHPGRKPILTVITPHQRLKRCRQLTIGGGKKLLK